jgi:toxin ParE1/3/4
MRYRVVFTPEAASQLDAIYTYIADQAGADIAFRFTDAIIAYCESFITFPRRGTLRNDLRPGLRTVGFRKRATIAFAVLGNAITIVGIFYGGQDVAGALIADD